jgi:predicted nucleotidyltransferase
MSISEITEREKLLKQELNRYLTLLIEHENPEKIILFGSTATGDIHEWSDIDLVIIKETDLPFLKRLHKIRRLLHPQVGTDILVYTPDEFKKMSETRLFVRDEILNKGIVLYERNFE